MTNPPLAPKQAKEQWLSECHDAPAFAQATDGETNYWRCGECLEPCDAVPPKQSQAAGNAQNPRTDLTDVKRLDGSDPTPVNDTAGLRESANHPQAQDAVEQMRSMIIRKLRGHHMPPNVYIGDGEPNIEHCADQIVAYVNRLLASARLDSAIAELSRLQPIQSDSCYWEIDDRLEQLQAERNKTKDKV